MIFKTIGIHLSGEDIANEFWELNSIEQADFFNRNAFVQDGYSNGYALFQIDNIVESLDDNGKDFIRRLYESIDYMKV